MFTKKITAFLIFLGMVFCFLPSFSPANAVSAGLGTEIQKQMDAAGGAPGAGLPASDPRIVVARIIRILLSLVGTLFMVMIVYAGYLWMTAGGNEDQVEKAKKRISQGVIGFIIILLAYAITEFAIRLVLGQEYYRYTGGFTIFGGG